MEFAVVLVTRFAQYNIAFLDQRLLCIVYQTKCTIQIYVS
jgi:hypothetical protein